MFMLHAGDQAKIEVLRGSEKIPLEISVIQRPHNVDRLADLVDPEKNWFVNWVYSGLRLTKRRPLCCPT